LAIERKRKARLAVALPKGARSGSCECSSVHLRPAQGRGSIFDPGQFQRSNTQIKTVASEGHRGTVGVPMLRTFVATIVALFCLLGLSARSDDVPSLDVNPVCHGIAMQGELEAGLQQTSFQQCVQSEQAVREEVKKEWSTFSTADKSHCVALAKTGGESSYTELITCMEMARDVRKLHSEANSLPEQNIPSSPVGHRQPTSR
jgi:hypothetical protein